NLRLMLRHSTPLPRCGQPACSIISASSRSAATSVRTGSRQFAALPRPRGAEADWSADLTLRHLPKLFQLARHLSNADPLLQQMKQIAAAWPLSSVGVAGLEA